jgi:hypothetical protein
VPDPTVPDPAVPDPGHELARTPGALLAQPGRGTERADRANWQDILDQLEGDVSRAEALTVGARMVGDPATPAARRKDAPSEEAPSEETLSDEALARRSVPLREGPWEPPRGHPPMPAHYAERARALLDRQIAIAAHIAREITMGRQQAAYAHHIGELEEVHPTPAFIDEAV